MSSVKYVDISTDWLQVGAVLKFPILDSKGILLLPPETQISAEFLAQLKSQSVGEVLLHPDDVTAATEGDASGDTAATTDSSSPEQAKTGIEAKIDALAATVSLVVENKGRALREKVIFPGAVPYDNDREERLTSRIGAVINLLDNMVGFVLSDGKPDARQLASVANNYVSELVEDSGHVVSTSANMAQGPEIVPRSIRLSILSMAMAIDMGYDEENVRTVGVAGLIHDWGWFHFDEALRDATQTLDNDQWQLIQQHPTHSVRYISQITGISELTCLVCNQVHELMDGSGYPRGIKGDAIHIFARILGVADAFISLVTPYRGRPPTIPYDAMVYMLHQVKQGRFDSKVVRALLTTNSMYPVGSHVQLDDGATATVLRPNPADYMKPVVMQLVDERGLRIDPPHERPIINLADGSRKVERPLVTPDREEMRIKKNRMDEILWDGPDLDSKAGA